MEVNVNKLYIYIANPSAASLQEARGHNGVMWGLCWESWGAGPGWETDGARALVQRSLFLETPSDRGRLGQAAGNSRDQGRTFARPILRLQEGDRTARGQLPHSGRDQAREAVGEGRR